MEWQGDESDQPCLSQCLGQAATPRGVGNLKRASVTKRVEKTEKVLRSWGGTSWGGAPGSRLTGLHHHDAAPVTAEPHGFADAVFAFDPTVFNGEVRGQAPDRQP